MKSGRASLTAQRVAAQRLTFERPGTAFGSPQLDELLTRDVAGDSIGSVSQLRDYLRARTRWVDEVVLAALDMGVSQVVINGAGYDGRALRFAKPGVRWFEVDHPSTQADKLGRLTRLGIDADHMTFLPVDFTVGMPATPLVEAGLDPAEATLFILEGVAVYLEPKVLNDVLSSLRAVAAPHSRLAVTFSAMATRRKAVRRRAAFQDNVARLGEPARSSVEPGEVDVVLAGTGWQRTGPSPTSPRLTDARMRALGFVLAAPA